MATAVLGGNPGEGQIGAQVEGIADLKVGHIQQGTGPCIVCLPQFHQAGLNSIAAELYRQFLDVIPTAGHE